MLSIIGKNDVPLYEKNLGFIKKQLSHIHHFILHAALDKVEEVTFSTSAMYLKRVDSHNEFQVYAYLTAGNVRFLLLTDIAKGDDTIRTFFTEIYDAFVKYMMNPLNDINSTITSKFFDEKIKAITAKYF